MMTKYPEVSVSVLEFAEKLAGRLVGSPGRDGPVQIFWDDCDGYSFEDSDRFEEDSICSWISEPESLCNNWRGWRRNIGCSGPVGNLRKASEDGPSNGFGAGGGLSGVGGPGGNCAISGMGSGMGGGSGQHQNQVGSLVEMCARCVASHIPFELVEHVYPPVPEQLQLRIAFWSFPDNEEDIRLYSCLANGSADEFQRGEYLLKNRAVKDTLQIGFHLSAIVTPPPTVGQGSGQFNVAVTFDRRRITSCNCTCSSSACWCSHVVAACLHRIHLPTQVCLRAPVSESLSRLHRDQLQKFAQYLISELPQQILPTAQRLLDELLSSQPSAINTVCGAPDPTAGASANDQTSWYLDEKTLHDNIKRILIKFCVPAPIVFSDVNYLGTTAPPAAAEWCSLLRPLRGREPEGMWNLLSIVREMFKRNDRNAIPLLEIITEECMACEQIMVWWFNTKVALQTGSSGPGGRHGGINSNSHAPQHASASLCDEIVQLWRLAALNPGLSPSERDVLHAQLREWHLKIVEKVTKSRGSTGGSSGGAGGSNKGANGFKNEVEVFGGFKPAIEACFLTWDDYQIPGITYSPESHLYHCPFACFRHGPLTTSGGNSESNYTPHVVNQVNASSAVINCERRLPLHHLSSHQHPNGYHFQYNVASHHHFSHNPHHLNHNHHGGHHSGLHHHNPHHNSHQHSSEQGGIISGNPMARPFASLNFGGLSDYEISCHGGASRTREEDNGLSLSSSRHLRGPSRHKLPLGPTLANRGEGNRSSVSSEGFCENDGENDLSVGLPNMEGAVCTAVDSDSQGSSDASSSGPSPKSPTEVEPCGSMEDSVAAMAVASCSGNFDQGSPTPGQVLRETKDGCVLSPKSAEDSQRDMSQESFSEQNRQCLAQGCTSTSANGGAERPLPADSSNSSDSNSDEYNVYYYDTKAVSGRGAGPHGMEVGRRLYSDQAGPSQKSQGSPSVLSNLASPGTIFANLRRVEDSWEILFARAEGLHAHGHGWEACTLGVKLADEMLANPPNLMVELPQPISKGKRRKLNPASHQISCLASATLSKCAFLCQVLAEYPEHHHLAFKIGLFGLELPRPPASTKPLEVKLANQDAELVQLLKRIPLGHSELRIIRDRAEQLRDGTLRSKGEGLLPFMLTGFIADALLLTGNGGSGGGSGSGARDGHMLNARLPTDESLGFDAAVAALGLKANISEADHPLLCEGTRRQRGDLAICLLVHYKDDPEKLARIMDKLLDREVHQLIKAPILSSYYSNNPPTTSQGFQQMNLRNEEMSAESMAMPMRNSHNSGDMPLTEANGGLAAGNGRQHMCPLAELDHYLGTLTIGNAPNPVVSNTRPKESSRRFKGKRAYPSVPNQPSEAGAHCMFELAKIVLNKAGGNSSTSLFTQVSTAQNHHGPHRALYICAFQIGLYALGLHNCVSHNWLSRTYSSHVSWITGQAMEIGAPAISFLIDTWEGHLTPPEAASIADKASRGRDPNMVRAAAELALSCLPHAHALNPNEIQRAILQCKEQSDQMLEHACLTVENAAKGGGVYPEVLFQVARYWYDLYIMHTPSNCEQYGVLELPHENALNLDASMGNALNNLIMDPISSEIVGANMGSGAGVGVPHMATGPTVMSLVPAGTAVGAGGPTLVACQSLPSAAPSPVTSSHQGLPPVAPLASHSSSQGPPPQNSQPPGVYPVAPMGSHATAFLPYGYSCSFGPPQFSQPLIVSQPSAAVAAVAAAVSYQYASTAAFVKLQPQARQFYSSSAPVVGPPPPNHHHHVYQLASQQVPLQSGSPQIVSSSPGPQMSPQVPPQQNPQPPPNQGSVIGQPPPACLNMRQNMTQSAQGRSQQQGRNQHQQAVALVNAVAMAQHQHHHHHGQPQGIVNSNGGVMMPGGVSAAGGGNGPGGLGTRQLRYLLAAYRVGMLAMDTLARRVHDDRPQAKYARNPPYGEDIRWLLLVSKKLGTQYLLQFCMCAVNSVVSPFVLHDIAIDAAYYLARCSPNLVLQHLRSGLNPLVQKCQQMYIQCLHQKLYHLAASDYDDFVAIVQTARQAFLITPDGNTQFKEWLQSIRRSNSCKKDLWTRINTALMGNTK
ncbi:zinc finger SWIM domain-containing protein 8 homolog [Hetaerina americana]|uniref:zinc finger SWIM domain-containing protein 8 homolog n=1 Tax=Hetaerina americana TaxID=62018 RepID=UPI003A7F2870